MLEGSGPALPDASLYNSQCGDTSVGSYLLMFLQNIAIGVAAVLGGLVLYKVIKNDDSVSFLRACARK